MLHKFLLFIFITVPIFTLAQLNINGEVIDENDMPLPYVEVEVYENNEYITDYVTEFDGKFNIQLNKGNYKIVGNHFGVDVFTMDIELNKNTDLGKIKVDNIIELEGIVLTGRVYKQEYDKFIFNVENSPLKKGYNGIEVLKRSPKLQVSSEGDIMLRNQSVLVLINGRKMNMSGEELKNYLNSIDSENIKSIEIQNVGSADTDASNSGGVINIVLKKVPIGFQTNVRTMYLHKNTENQLYFGGLSNQFGSDKWNIYNRINYQEDENSFKYNSTKSFHENSNKHENKGSNNLNHRHFNTSTGVFFYPNSKHEIGAEIYYSNSKVKRDGFDILDIYNPNLIASAENIATSYDKGSFWNLTTNYTYKIDSLGSNLKFIADFGNNKVDRENEVDTKYYFGNLEDSRNLYLTDAVSKFYNIQTDWNQKFKSNFEFNFGAKFSNVSRDNQLDNFLYIIGWTPNPDLREDFKNNENIFANYFSIATRIGEKHQLKAGIRTEYTEIKGTDFINNTEVKQDYFDWFPSLYYGYDLTEKQTLSLSYSKRIQRPSFGDLNPFVIKLNDFLYQIGNPDLKPQYTDKLELEYQNRNHSFSIYGDFTKNYLTGIYTTDNDQISYYSPQNFGKIKDYGLDYSYSGNITKWFYSNISFGSWYYKYKVQDTNHSRASLYLSSFFQFNLTNSLSLDVFNYYTSPNQFGVTKGAKQYQLNIGLQKSFGNGSGLMRLAFEDVFNTIRDKNTSYYNDFDFRFYQKRTTRSILLSLTFMINNKNQINERNVESQNENKSRL